MISLITGRNGRLTEASLAARFRELQSRLETAQSLARSAENDLAALREHARAHGLGRELHALENPQPVAPPQRDPADTKVRVLPTQSFSTTDAGVAYYGVAGDVVRVPRALAKALVANGIAENVADDTPVGPRR